MSTQNEILLLKSIATLLKVGELNLFNALTSYYILSMIEQFGSYVQNVIADFYSYNKNITGICQKSFDYNISRKLNLRGNVFNYMLKSELRKNSRQICLFLTVKNVPFFHDFFLFLSISSIKFRYSRPKRGWACLMNHAVYTRTATDWEWTRLYGSGMPGRRFIDSFG